MRIMPAAHDIFSIDRARLLWLKSSPHLLREVSFYIISARCRKAHLPLALSEMIMPADILADGASF